MNKYLTLADRIPVYGGLLKEIPEGAPRTLLRAWVMVIAPLAIAAGIIAAALGPDQLEHFASTLKATIPTMLFVKVGVVAIALSIALFIGGALTIKQPRVSKILIAALRYGALPVVVMAVAGILVSGMF